MNQTRSVLRIHTFAPMQRQLATETLIRTPSRLHFGLFGFGAASRRQFGGVGAMLQQPSVQLSLRPNSQFQVGGPLSSRVREYSERWRQWHDRDHLPRCLVEVVTTPRLHIGLGIGTQLGLAVAYGLNLVAGIEDATPTNLAQSVGRGLRSAVGTYGFLDGGLVVESGKSNDEVLSPLEFQGDIPETWRFVLCIPKKSEGLSGGVEQQAFDKLSTQSQDLTDKLVEEAHERMIPALQRKQFGDFSESVYRYGRMSGSLFAEVQGGPYNGKHLERLVDRIRALGVAGVGQSSWGPSIFAITKNQEDAEQLTAQLQDESEIETLITAANNQGVQVEELED